MIRYAHWILSYGIYIGVILLIIASIVFLYVYAYVHRTLKRLDTLRFMALIVNSYIFAMGLFLVLITSGVL